MKKIKTSINYDQFKKDHEKPYGVSETVPDQTMTIRQIVDRFTKGVPVDGGLDPVYTDDDDLDIDLPDPRSLDLVEQQELKEQARDRVNELKELQKKKPKKALKQGDIEFNPDEQGSIDPAARITPLSSGGNTPAAPEAVRTNNT